MAPTISGMKSHLVLNTLIYLFQFLLAISSGGAAAAALGRRRRSIDDHYNFTDNRTANVICLSKLSKIISSLNELVKESEIAKQEKATVYFNQLVDLQKQCEFNFSLPVDFYEEMNNILNLNDFHTRSNDKKLKKLKDSYYLYSLGNGKSNLLDTILNFFFNFDLIKDRNQISTPAVSNQFRTNSNHTGGYFNSNEFSTYQPSNFFHFKEGKCLQEMVCKVLLSPKFEKSLFSNLISVLATITPSNFASKYGLDVLVFGLKGHNCMLKSVTYC